VPTSSFYWGKTQGTFGGGGDFEHQDQEHGTIRLSQQNFLRGGRDREKIWRTSSRCDFAREERSGAEFLRIPAQVYLKGAAPGKKSKIISGKEKFLKAREQAKREDLRQGNRENHPRKNK